MTIEIRPVGINCNLQCKYCYQWKMREGSPATKRKDPSKLIEKLENTASGNYFTLFGGEALLTPIEDLETYWKYGYEKYGQNGIQTNGVLINDRHIELFKKYNVHVGISFDGTGSMNDLRWAGSLEKTRKCTEMTWNNAKRLVKEGIIPSMIITLHELNASKKNIGKFKEWIKEVDSLGIWSIRLHILEKEDCEADKYALSPKEYAEAFIDIADFCSKENIDIEFDVFHDINSLLKGKDNYTTCMFNNCDPLNTASVDSIDYEGVRGCGRPNKNGVDWNKCKTMGFERSYMLYHIPQENGGCKDCKYFIICRGNCPGNGIDGDWRNRSEYCEMWKILFDYFEKKHLEVGIVPITMSPSLKRIERALLDSLRAGQRTTIEYIINNLDNNTYSCNNEYISHLDSCHGDVPHGDSYENHNDFQ